MILVATTAISLFNTTWRRSRPSFLSAFLLHAPFWNDVPVLLLNHSSDVTSRQSRNLFNLLNRLQQKYKDGDILVWLTQRVQPHYDTIGFIYLFLHESRVPVTWTSIVVSYGAPVCVSHLDCAWNSSAQLTYTRAVLQAWCRIIFFRWSYHELVLLTQANPLRPGLCYKCSLCESFYALRRRYLTALIFGTGCTTLKRVITLSQANNYRLDLSVQVVSLIVWKCLKVFESVWSHLKVPESEISCIAVAFSLHRWEFTEAYLKTKKVNMGISIEQYRSSIGSHDNFVKT